ncbi:hypothetical protein DU000_01410 [Parvibium lacunae]|uniref:Oxidoreductase n=1 Tax=Parvibium lacunae TaxID=1888893 RepID=A0A368L6X9_9BURK|nr:anaerobic ribonucleoside-triphosphate reductase [Parvibium lacunae]RCS59420.1 hypothetical protein DU000_01410 [Parvibium lacunae]
MHTQTVNPSVSTINTLPAAYQARRQRCEVWTRVMGYHRPVSAFNIGKQGEFAERQYFVAPTLSASHSVPAPMASAAQAVDSCCV